MWLGRAVKRAEERESAQTMIKHVSAFTLACLLIVFVLGGLWLRTSTYFPLVVVVTPGDLTVTFLQRAREERESCISSVSTIASLMQANCPTCVVRQQECVSDLTSEMRMLLSEKPVNAATARMINGVIAFAHADAAVSLAACVETEKQSLSRNPPQGRVVCNPPNAIRTSSKGLLPDGLSSISRGIAQGAAAIGAGICLLLLVQLLAVRSPTDFAGGTTPALAYAKPSNLAKRLFDVSIAICLLVLLFPLLLLVSLLILLFEGYPIFYISNRYISLDQNVRIYKFRTMVRDANSPKYRLRERFMRDGYLDIPLGCEVYTGLGRFLERLQLVELLQLFNVIVDGMSLVGNRPLPKENIELLKKFPGWEGRFDSPAGITGISQIVGKLNQSPAERIELERLYSNLYRSAAGNIFYCDVLILWYTIRLLILGKPISVEHARQIVLRAGGGKD